MKIKIYDPEENKKFFIWLPTHLLINSFFASIAPLFLNNGIKKYGVSLKTNGKSLRKFVRGFYKARRHFGGKLNFVEVESAKGEVVKITL